MKTTSLTPEQFAQYEAIASEYDRFRRLSPEEKEDLIIRIATSTYIDLLCDWAFKHVFGHNEKNLMLLLNDILPEKIIHIEYEPNEIDLWKGDDKKVIMDVLCHTEDGRKIIVEMQRADKEFLRNRLLFYGASMIHTQLHKGESYGKLVPVYVVCFMNFRLQHDTDKLIYTYQLRETTGEGYTKRSILNLYLCELPRFAGDPGKASNPVEVWFDILQNMSNFARKPEPYGGKYDPIFESSRQSPIPDQDKLQYFRSMFNDDIRSYLTDEDRKEIAEEFFAEGIKKGIGQGIEQVARRLKEVEGIPSETISAVTGLSVEEIQALS
jgi:predicted transposase/invertase (TIGR01784 family)